MLPVLRADKTVATELGLNPRSIYEKPVLYLLSVSTGVVWPSQVPACLACSLPSGVCLSMESMTEPIWVVGGCTPTVLPQPCPLTMEQGPIPMTLGGVASEVGLTLFFHWEDGSA